ncbi:discoidin domain-containing protein [Paenibacillus dokdonensis]|uniref:discoidin domain-containing protein n=1 Tax=Paenibacillus dokdonensis TaxID=2567944 RepID=UPI0010A88C33|nr:discoidin domain-containing protein [Paenibacillus dokdonensis]
MKTVHYRLYVLLACLLLTGAWLLFGPEFVSAASVGPVSDFKQTDDKTFTITSGQDKVKVIFERDDMVRIWLGVNGQFTNIKGKNAEQPAEPIVIKDDFGAVQVNWSDEGSYYKMETGKFVLRAYKAPLKFAMYHKDNQTVVWEEAASLSYNGQSTSQQLVRGEDEYFYGGGMQNGYFSHRDRKIAIAENYGDWGSGTVSNPSPFYLSTAGYGVLRNTFQNGMYDFDSTVRLTHDENRFDAYYFYGDNIKDILNGLTDLTGKPALIPRWGMGLGDANCYNKAPATTKDVIEKIAQAYRDNDMPGSWILPNDGYGCGYTDLGYTVNELKERGFYTGLWTQNGVEQIAHEVGVDGTRLAKLDVAWVGPGYDFALNGTKQAYQGIEKYSNDRGYVWSVGGWAGTQRYSTVWSGDQSGSWEYIRFHIPTLIGAGLSGIPYATGDIDGIFGGSAKTYVRDLQWKAFTPILMNMSGWAAKDKQPWVWGEPYTSYNRDILKLRQRLTPYFYTYLNEAYETGAPLVRGMIYSNPEDPNSKGTLTQYQFMSGDSLLVAPVYSDTTTRNGIYLPKGKWIDYWTGESHYGSKMLDEYAAPLNRLPLLVKAGAIIPMYPESLYDGQNPANPVTYDIYPYKTSSFTMYEDDGVTKEHRTGKFAKTRIESIAPEQGTGDLTVKVGASIGDYTGKPASRVSQFTVHMPNQPEAVVVEGSAYAKLDTKAAYDAAASGWFYDKSEKGGVLYVKTPELSASRGFELKVSGFTADVTPLTDAVKIELPQEDTDPSRIPQDDIVATTSSADPTTPAANVLDGNYESIWSTPLDGSAKLPQSITLNLGTKQYINKIKVLPRQYGGKEGVITGYNISTSLDGVNYALVSTGQWNDDKLEKTAVFETVEAAYARIEVTAGVSGFASAAEMNVYRDLTKPAPIAIPKNEMKASALSFQPGSEAAKAIDGDRNSVWHTKWDGSDKLPQSIILDLSKVREISQFRYAPRTDAGNGTMTTYNLYVSLDGQVFTKVSSGTWLRNSLKKYIQFEPVSARYVKLEAVAAVGGFASASELDVYEAPKQAPQLQVISEGKKATADSEDTDHPASAGNDGKLDTRWSAADTKANHTFTVDLAAMYSIQASEVSFEHSDKAYGYKIETRENDKSNWITVADHSGNPSAGAVLKDTFGSRGRYVRITVTGLPDSSTKASFWEFKIYGLPSGEGVKATGVSLDQTTLALHVQDKPALLVATVEPDDAANKSVTWSSSDPGVAVIDTKGSVSPKGAGKATITVTTVDGGFTATSEVTVSGQQGLMEIPQSQMSATATSSEAGVNDPSLALDANPDTHWHTKWYNVDPLPQSIIVNLGGSYKISKLGYLPRPDAGNGTITAYNVYASTDGVAFTKIAEGTWLRNKQLKEVNFTPIVANYVKLEAVQGVGDFASAAELTVFKVSQADNGPAAHLNMEGKAASGKEFTVRLDMNQLSQQVFAQDMTIEYDPKLMSFVSVESLIPGVKIVESQLKQPGKVRLIIASEGAEHGVTGDQAIAALTFKAADISATVSGDVNVSDILLGDEKGAEVAAASASARIEITTGNTGASGDINGDGKVSIGDLAILAAHYGKDTTSSDWDQIKHLDLDGSGSIDIADLAFVAKKIAG